MNKTVIDKMLPYAYNSLANSKLVVDNKINKSNRGQISSFGAAIFGGSLLAAIAFFSDNGGSGSDRKGLMKCVLQVLKEYEAKSEDCKEKLYERYNDLFTLVYKNLDKETEIKEAIINASIAIKLAMNLFTLVKDDSTKKAGGNDE